MFFSGECAARAASDARDADAADAAARALHALVLAAKNDFDAVKALAVAEAADFAGSFAAVREAIFASGVDMAALLKEAGDELA